MFRDLANLCIEGERTILETIERMDRNRLGIIMVVTETGHLVGTVTDGDIRRAILAAVDFQRPIISLIEHKADSIFAAPISAPVDADPSVWLALLQQYRILHLPLLDGGQRVIALVTLDEFLPDQHLPLRAVVMAGGAGKRLRPLTDDTPKPMLLVGDRPLMEIIIEQLREAGVRRVKLSTHHISEKISSHFGDGARFGVELSYLAEDQPLGTAGALAGLQSSTETLLVMNGDILTRVDFRALAAFHREHQADLTVCVRQYDVEVPFGVVETDGTSVTALTEKPTLKFFVNAGIYLLEPQMCAYIPLGQRFDMTDLIQRLIEEKRTVVSFPVREYWLDIGQIDDYNRAQKDVASWQA